MECIFSRHDLSWLDDVMPERVRKEVEEKKAEKDVSSIESEDVSMLFNFFLMQKYIIKRNLGPLQPPCGSLFPHSVNRWKLNCDDFLSTDVF